MKSLTDAENGFRFKGVWWTETTFTDELKLVLSLHRAMSNRRIAFHFGASEKAVRKLRARSQTADSVVLFFTAETKCRKEMPARYCGRDRNNYYPEDKEAKKILVAAEVERDRQQEIRHAQRGQRRCQAARLEQMRAQRREAVQRCKISGLTQVLAAERLSCSVRTVRRYW